MALFEREWQCMKGNLEGGIRQLMKGNDNAQSEIKMALQHTWHILKMRGNHNAWSGIKMAKIYKLT